MNLLREKLKCGGLHGVLMGGGGGKSSSATNSTTVNTDRRVAVDAGVGISGDGNEINDFSSYNDTDAVKAVAQMGADVIKSSGGAVVELAKIQTDANTDAWNTTITEGAKLVDKLIDQSAAGFALSEKVVSSFQPSENKQTDALKWGLLAAAAVAGAVILKGKA